MQFVDTARIYVKGGKGGSGCLSFRREKYVPRGGPDGGNGGKGGEVYLEADPNLSTLLDLAYRPHWAAGDGGNGGGGNKTGRSGEDVVLRVPCGTLVKELGQTLADLVRPGQRVLAARGGRGGRGNASFKSNRNRAPRIAEKGEPGREATLELELKVLADAGLVGLPNAGKSTFLARVSRAKPKIADYPFTTLSPHLGLVRHKHKDFVLADIPGLIEGAHRGKGLGIAFLRHLERTRVLIHLVDPSPFSGQEAVGGVRAVERELKRFSEDLYRKPRLLVVNKSDLDVAGGVLKKLKSARRQRVFLVSALTGRGIERVLDEASRLLSRSETRSWDAPASSGERQAAQGREPWLVRKTGAHRFEVGGAGLERLAAMTQFQLPQAARRFAGILKKIGVERHLKRLGARPGDEIRIGPQDLVWTEQACAAPPGRRSGGRYCFSGTTEN